MQSFTVIVSFLAAIVAAAPSADLEKRDQPGAYFCENTNWQPRCYHHTGWGCLDLGSIGFLYKIRSIGADQGSSCTMFASRDCTYADDPCVPNYEGCFKGPHQRDIGYPGTGNTGIINDRMSGSIQCWA